MSRKNMTTKGSLPVPNNGIVCTTIRKPRYQIHTPSKHTGGHQAPKARNRKGR